ncbi:MAG: non-ribosomal peptide synthetase [Hydrococcus sp. RM1_1_31]|nr:non-ribosomal peptide synthetase [Hydrococcus sp. RM1_1_31]
MKTENIQDIYQLTPLQKGILFHSLYAPEFGLYIIQIRYSLRGELDISAFERAWQQIIERHTVLRTSFYWEDIDNPLQVVYKQVQLPLQQYDWREIEPVEQQRRLKEFILSDRKQGFDLSQECLMHLTLIRLGDDVYEFIWSKHHLIMDGWSVPVVLKEFVQIYEAFAQKQPISLEPSRPFRDYIDWLQQQDIAKTEAFWRQALKEVKEPTSLKNLEIDSFCDPRSDPFGNRQERYDEEQIKLSTATTAALQSLAKQHQLTLNTLIQGAWAILLGRYSCRNKVVYGCTVSGRPVELEGIESMVGVFINTLPIYVELDPQQFLVTWLQRFQNQLAQARHYEYTPLTDIQGWSEVPRSLPLFESIVVFENQPVTQFLQEWKGNIEVRDSSLFYKTNYPLTIVAYPGFELAIAISYDFQRFDTQTIRSILHDFTVLLQNMTNNPQVRLKDLRILSEEQQQRILMLEQEATFNFNLAVCS